MNRALLALALLTVPFSSYSSIFDSLPTEPKVTGYTASMGCSTFSHQNILCDVMGYSGGNDLNYQSIDPTAFCEADRPNHGGVGIVDAQITYGALVDTGPGSQRQDFGISCTISRNDAPSLTANHPNFSYFLAEVQVCPAGTVVHEDQCYDEFLVLSSDSCATPTSYDAVFPANGSTDAQVCQSLPDGSKCKYKLDGDAYYSDFEDTGCYDGTLPELSLSGNVQPDENSAQQCQDIGNGSSACLEDPVNVCNNGTCRSGCGTVGIGGADPVFVCISGDTDGDGIGDYADPDIDGDGIANIDDFDFDGDGVNDANYNNPDYTPSSIGNGVVGGGGSGASGQEIGQQLTEKLTEQADIAGIQQSAEDAIDQSKTDYDTAVDTLLEDENFELENTVTESGLEDSLDPLLGIFQQKPCQNTITIPHSNSTLDLCGAAALANPILYIIFAISTVIYIFRRITNNIKDS